MVTFKRFRSIALAGLFFTVCMVLSLALNAQTAVEATILTTNVDVQDTSLYVEMNYTPKACGNYQLRFRLQDKEGTPIGPNGTGYEPITLVEVISNNHGTQKIGTFTPPGVPGAAAITVLNLDNTAVGGYSLRFHMNSVGTFIPKDVTAGDSLRVCLEVYRTAYRCKYCGVGRSDRLFTDSDIEPSCPYPNTNGDLVACGKRGGARNWEAYIQDPRDCKVYRVVEMPHAGGNLWWFAQNLSYYKDLHMQTGAQGTIPLDSGTFFCPGINNQPSNQAFELGGEITWGCDVYGALYTQTTASLTDGTGVIEPFDTITSTPKFSAMRGICPPGWFIPNDAQWGIMLNSVEGCANADEVNNERTPLSLNCNHFTSTKGTAYDLTTTMVQGDGGNASPISVLNNMSISVADHLYYYDLGKSAGQLLKSTPTCNPLAPGISALSCDNTNGNNAANKFGLYASGATIRFASTRWGYSEGVTGNDHYGFSVLPAGFRYAAGTSSRFHGRGSYAIFMSSTKWDTNNTPVYRMFTYSQAQVKRFYTTATAKHAVSVRCITAQQ